MSSHSAYLNHWTYASSNHYQFQTPFRFEIHDVGKHVVHEIFTLRVLSVFDRNYQIAGFVAEKGLTTACSQFRGSSASQSDYSYANQKNQNECKSFSPL